MVLIQTPRALPPKTVNAAGSVKKLSMYKELRGLAQWQWREIHVTSEELMLRGYFHTAYSDAAALAPVRSSCVPAQRLLWR